MAAEYCADTCIIIDLLTRYPADTFVGLVDNIRHQIAIRSVVSIDTVHDELKQGRKHSDAEVQELLQISLADFFSAFDQDATDELPNITSTSSAYRRKRRTKKNADPYLVAYCRAHGLILLTNDEALSVAAQNDGVNVVSFVGYMKKHGWKFR